MLKKKIKPALLNIKPYVPGRPIEEVKRELGLDDVIKLASNENPYDASPKVLNAMKAAIKNINRYPDGGCYYLRETIAKRLKIAPEQIIFGNGSDEIIVLAARAFIGEGDEAIIAQPSFLIYDLATRLEGGVVKAIPLQNNFRYDLESMRKAVTKKTKVIFIGNPDNPSGQYFTEKEIVNFLNAIPNDILVFIDEAYFEYVKENDYINSLKLLKKYKNVIVSRTFSKIYGLAGLRVGYGIADTELIGLLNRIRDPFNVNSVAQAAAVACLGDQAYYDGIFEKVNDQREFIYESLRKLNIEFVKTFTNFVLVKVPGRTIQVVSALLKRGVIVRDMSGWGVKDYFRVSIGNEKENKKFVKELKSIMQ